MYIVDNPITITWILKAEADPPAESSYDISLVTSELNGTYVNAGISNYLAPTATTAGSITYTLTVEYPGRFKLNLTIGTESNHTVIEETWLYVFSNIAPIVGRLEAFSPKSTIKTPLPNLPVTIVVTQGDTAPFGFFLGFIENDIGSINPITLYGEDIRALAYFGYDRTSSVTFQVLIYGNQPQNFFTDVLPEDVGTPLLSSVAIYNYNGIISSWAWLNVPPAIWDGDGNVNVYFT